MKILALNSSPRGDRESKTAILLEALTKGMEQVGATIERVQLRKKNIKNCIGCYTCWTKTPGKCVLDDDMTNNLFPKWLKSDIVIYATPLYHYTVNARMKAFIERTLPAWEPYLKRMADRTHHPVRQKPPKAVVVSVAGFPESSVFSYLSSYVNMLFGKGLLAEIYRPASEVMTLPPFAEKTRAILAAVEAGGRELVESMKISPQTMENITAPIVEDFDSFADMANVFWKSCIEQGLTPAEFHKKDLAGEGTNI
ncbi:MAG: flavodoxin family protein [Desulfomonilaceae bacterium]